jgi:hypothetical protein
LFSESEAAATQNNSSVEASENNEGSLVSKIIGLIAAVIPPNNQVFILIYKTDLWF